MAGSQSKEKNFVHVTSSVDGSKQSVGITASGRVFTWGRRNDMGQLGRATMSSNERNSPSAATLKNCTSVSTTTTTTAPKAIRGYAGGIGESGHTAVLDAEGHLWVAGCDRWQQLGLGSAAGGSSGYTWENGRIWRDFFTRNDFIRELMDEQQKGEGSIRDVALGGDHTLVLSTNKKDVYAFGKGGEGQLGLAGKAFVSAPIRSTVLSSKGGADIAAVCGIRDCSLTLDSSGNVLNKAGRCRMARDLKVALSACVERAERDGLLNR